MFTLSPEGFRPRSTFARPSAGPQLTHLPATLTSHLQRPEKSATLSLAFATLTSPVKHKSCVCHSYKKHRGWGGGKFCRLPRGFPTPAIVPSLLHGARRLGAISCIDKGLRADVSLSRTRTAFRPAGLEFPNRQAENWQRRNHVHLAA